MGPSKMAPAPAKPSVAHPPNCLRLPSRCVTCSTLDVRLMKGAGYPPVRKVTSCRSSASSRLTVPPADAKLAKALMLGISTLSTTNRFSRGLPPRTMMSLRKSLVPITTPGRPCTYRDTSCRAAALLRISRGSTRKPEFFTASGAWNAGAVTVTVCWKSSTVGSVISTVPSSPARTSTGSLVKGRPSRGRISSRYAGRAQLTDAKHAAGVAGGARGGVERTHAHALGRLASGVHDHAADRADAGGVLCRRRRADEGQHDGGQRRRKARTEREVHDVSRVSRHASAEADEFLLVGVVVGQDQPSRPDDRGVTLGATSARP